MEKFKSVLAVVWWGVIVAVGLLAYVWAFAKDILSKFAHEDDSKARLKGFREGFAEGVRYQKWRYRKEEI